MELIQAINKANVMNVSSVSEFSDSILETFPYDASCQYIVNQCLKKATSILEFVQRDAAIPLFIFQSKKDDIPTFTRHMFTLALFGKLNVFNDHFLQHIIAAHILSYQMSATQGNTLVKRRKVMLQFLSDKHLQLWRQVVSLQKVAFSSHAIKHIGDPRLTPVQLVSLLASIFSYCSEKQSQSSLLSFVTKRITPLFRNLLHSVSVLIAAPLPGSQMYYKAYTCTVMELQRNHALIYIPNSSENEQLQWVKRTSLQLIEQRTIAFDAFLSCYSRCNNERNISGGHSFFPESFAIQRPPSVLLSIIDELHKPDVNIPQLCKKIDSASSFQQFLLSTASQDNRLRLPVTNIKQAILTYGLERVGDMLVQFALMERLTQHQYPLLAMSKQFTLLTCAIAGQLASITRSKFSPQSAALVSTFLCAPLFTTPGLKIATALPVNSQNYYQIHHIFKVRGKNPWHEIAGELADNWHQGATWRALIRQVGKTQSEVPTSLKKEYAILQLSFGLAREYLFPLERRDKQTDETRQALLNTLALTIEDLELLMGRLGEYLYCPLSLHP